VNEYLSTIGSSQLTQAMTMAELLRRPEIKLSHLAELGRCSGLSLESDLNHLQFSDEVELLVKYAGYIKRQEEQVARFKKMEKLALPEDIDYKRLSGLSNEVVEKLGKVRPRSLGQASRISGITPAAISVLQVHLKKLQGQSKR